MDKQYGLLTVVEQAASRHGKTYWWCICECGGETTVQGAHLTLGAIRSCSCLRDEANRARATHGDTGTALYKAWCAMKWRCSPNAKDHRPYYHDRGIRVCERWATSYEAFRDDMGSHPGEGLTLDRENNGGIYERGNCRWATRSEQNSNRRGWAVANCAPKADTGVIAVEFGLTVERRLGHTRPVRLLLPCTS